MRTGAEVLEAIVSEVKRVKSQGWRVVSLDALLSYFEEVKAEDALDTPAGASHELELAKLSATHEHARGLELKKIVAEAAGAPLKTARLVNGGAAMALLALVGNIIGRVLPNGSHLHMDWLAQAMLWFAMGVFVAWACEFLRFLAYLLEFNSWPTAANTVTAVMCGSVLGSYFFFLMGGYVAFRAIA